MFTKKVPRILAYLLVMTMMLSLCTVSAFAAPKKGNFFASMFTPTASFDVPSDIEVGDTVRVPVSVSSNVRSVSWSLTCDDVKQKILSSSKRYVTFVVKSDGEYELNCTVSSVFMKKTYTDKFTVENRVEPLEITSLSVPSTGVVGEPFTVSGTATGAAHFSWYVNRDGQDYAFDDNLDDNGGQICLNEPGEYDIIFMVYDEDWHHVSETKSIVIEEPKEALEIVDVHVPFVVTAGEPFTVSVETTGARNVEWYVEQNGHGYALPEVPVGFEVEIQIDEPGEYEIVCMPYDDDWNYIHEYVSITVEPEQKEPLEILTFDVPEKAVAGEPFEVSGTASGAVHYSWYVNKDGQDYAFEDNLTDNGGQIVLTEPGRYAIIFKAYDEDWQSVSQTKYITIEPALSILSVSVPETVTAGEPFTASVDAAGARNVEWYVRKDGHGYELSEVPVGFEVEIQIDEPGEYEIICMPYDDTWTYIRQSVFITVEPAQNDQLEILSMSVPEKAVAGENFDVSATAANAAHLEWYVNVDGEDYPVPEGLSDNGGSICFENPGVYDIIFMAFDDGWKNHVHKTMSVTVYAESVLDGNTLDKTRAMYSWSSKYMDDENEAILQQVMDLTNCNRLYQEVSSSADYEYVADFLDRRDAAGQEVWYLCGDASWALEPGAASMIAEVERVAGLNAHSDVKFAGIQFDVEPYCLDDFDENADAYFPVYVENCKHVYQVAQSYGIPVEICIPYWWDSAYGFDEGLEDLIANACDSVAVMNYYKAGKEIKHIADELALCEKYDKPIVNITEMQAPGTHGLTENNTYYNDGVDAVEAMWSDMEAYFGYDNLGYSYHYLNVMIELLGL